MRKKIGECLVQAGLITEADLEIALVEHRRAGERLGAVLVRMNMATERQIAKALAYQLGFAYVNLVEHPPDLAAVTLIPKDVALKRACIAVALERNLLTVAMSDPLLFSLVQDLEFQTGHRIKQVVATRSEIIDAIHASYPDKALARTERPGSGLAVRPSRERRQGSAEEAGKQWAIQPWKRPDGTIPSTAGDIASMLLRHAVTAATTEEEKGPSPPPSSPTSVSEWIDARDQQGILY